VILQETMTAVNRGFLYNDEKIIVTIK